MAVLLGVVVALVPDTRRALTVTHRRRSGVEQVLAARSEARRACLVGALLEVPAGSHVLFYPDPDAVLTKLSGPRLLSVAVGDDAAYVVGLRPAAAGGQGPGVRCGDETLSVQHATQ